MDRKAIAYTLGEQVAGLRPLLVPLRKIQVTPIGGISALTADSMACWEEEIAYWLEYRARDEQHRDKVRKCLDAAFRRLCAARGLLEVGLVEESS